MSHQHPFRGHIASQVTNDSLCSVLAVYEVFPQIDSHQYPGKEALVFSHLQVRKLRPRQSVHCPWLLRVLTPVLGLFSVWGKAYRSYQVWWRPWGAESNHGSWLENHRKTWDFEHSFGLYPMDPVQQDRKLGGCDQRGVDWVQGFKSSE